MSHDNDAEDELRPDPAWPTYGFRPSMMSGPHVFVLEPDVLAWQVGRYSGKIPYREIKRIRLSYRPVTLASHRFITEIWSDLAPKLTIASTSWRSLVEQQRHDAEYAAFVRAFARRLGEARGPTQFLTGSSPFLYWPGAVLCSALGLGFPWIIVRSMQAGTYGAAGLIALLFLVFAWQMGNVFYRNQPGTFRPFDVPAAVLPRA